MAERIRLLPENTTVSASTRTCSGILAGVIDIPSIRECLCLHTRRTARLLTQFYDEALRPSGLGVLQFTLLAAAGEAGEITLQPLADLMGMDRTTLTRNLAVLQRDGMVRVRQGKEDRRERIISLTSKGRAAVQLATTHWQAAQSEILRRVGSDDAMPEAAALRDTLNRLGRLSQD